MFISGLKEQKMSTSAEKETLLKFNINHYFKNIYKVEVKLESEFQCG